MEESVRVKRYFGLKLARTIFKLLTFLSAFFIIILIILQIVASVRDPEIPISTVLGAVSGDALLRVLLFYTMYQIIDIVLSINDNLRQLVQVKPQAASEQPPSDGRANQRIMGMLEKQHRRIERLEQESRQ